MAEQQMPAHGTICWTELATKDSVTAKKFYTELFGWQLKASEAAGVEYTEYYADGRPWGGIMQIAAEWGEVPSHWMSYVAVNNVDESASRAQELGATIKVPPMDIPNTGRFCVITDPTGATIAMITLNAM